MVVKSTKGNYLTQNQRFFGSFRWYLQKISHKIALAQLDTGTRTILQSHPSLPYVFFLAQENIALTGAYSKSLRLEDAKETS
jgi:hypothetical protein